MLHHHLTKFAGCACVDGDRNKWTVVALLIIGNFCLGWVESLTLTMVGMVIDDQNELTRARRYVDRRRAR